MACFPLLIFSSRQRFCAGSDTSVSLDAQFQGEVFPNQALRAVLDLLRIEIVAQKVAGLIFVAYIRGNVPVKYSGEITWLQATAQLPRSGSPSRFAVK